MKDNENPRKRENQPREENEDAKRSEVSETPDTPSLPAIRASNQIGLPSFEDVSSIYKMELSKYPPINDLHNRSPANQDKKASNGAKGSTADEYSSRRCLVYLLSVDFVFHTAIYRSLSPSEGVTINCVSTNRDIEYLKENGILPSYRYC